MAIWIFKLTRKKYFPARKKSGFFPHFKIGQYSRFHTFRTSSTVPLPRGSIFRPKTTSFPYLFGEGFICHAFQVGATGIPCKKRHEKCDCPETSVSGRANYIFAIFPVTSKPMLTVIFDQKLIGLLSFEINSLTFFV